LNGGQGADTLKGNRGKDFISAVDGDGTDTVSGGRGNDICFLDEGDARRSCETITVVGG
jgi:Ca2+-binding RTX toxin-like protein